LCPSVKPELRHLAKPLLSTKREIEVLTVMASAKV
jgi:hypothetical protein